MTGCGVGGGPPTTAPQPPTSTSMGFGSLGHSAMCVAATPPFTNAASPYPNVTPPYPNVTPPFVSATPPFVSATPPFIELPTGSQSPSSSTAVPQTTPPSSAAQQHGTPYLTPMTPMTSMSVAPPPLPLSTSANPSSLQPFNRIADNFRAKALQFNSSVYQPSVPYPGMQSSVAQQSVPL